MRLGMTSVTFRTLSPARIVALAKEAGLDFMEWGTDVHAKTAEDAREIRALCDGAGLTTASLGSYYRVGVSERAVFENDLASARILGAKRIRLWLGSRASANTDEKLFMQMKDEVRSLAVLAAGAGIELAFEFHRRTLSDNGKSCVAFLNAVKEENVKTYWQPFFEGNDKENLETVKDRVSAVHLFSWDGAANRFPFEACAEEWKGFFAALSPRLSDVDLIMEFVKDDSEQQFFADVKTIRCLLAPFDGK